MVDLMNGTYEKNGISGINILPIFLRILIPDFDITAGYALIRIRQTGPKILGDWRRLSGGGLVRI